MLHGLFAYLHMVAPFFTVPHVDAQGPQETHGGRQAVGGTLTQALLHCD